MDGEVVSIDQYPTTGNGGEGGEDKPLVFVVKSSDETAEKYRFEYTGFLPLKKGDIISIDGRIKEKARGKRFVLQDKPLVYIPTKADNLANYFREALLTKRKGGQIKGWGKGRRLPIDIGKKIYEEMYQKFGSHEGVLKSLNTFAIEFYVEITETERNNIYWWWRKNVLRRQLYLLGLYNKEIDESGLREDVLFKMISENPVKATSLSMEKAIEINQLFRRETEKGDIICGEILRKLVEFKKKGWYYVPARIMKKAYPSIEKYYSTLVDEYDVICETISSSDDEEIDKKEEILLLKSSYETENYIAARIKELIKLDEIANKMREKMGGISFAPRKGKKGRSPVNIYDNIELTEEQEEALKGSLRNHITIITGGAGCGKTTLLRQIIKNLEEKGRKFMLTSFTGKAVMRIKEVICSRSSHKEDEEIENSSSREEGKLRKEYESRCMTMSRIIHKLKGFQSVPQFDTLIIDEASMVSTGLFHTFLTLFTTPFKIILVGDCNQLDPIEGGSMLKELIDSGKVPTYRLTINKRSEGKTLIKNANGLIGPDRDYKKPFRFISGESFFVIDGEVDTVRKIVKGLWKGGIDDKSITILTPVNRYIPILVSYHHQTYLRKKRKMKYGERVFYFEDRILQKKNFYSEDLEIMNGEEGIVTDINDDFLEVTFREDKVVGYQWDSRPSRVTTEDESDGDSLTIDSIMNSFAKTIHKSQGSEYDYVIIYLPPENFSFVSVNMLYTAITRAKKKLWIVSDLSTLDRITTQTLGKRHELLGYRLSNDGI